MNYTSQIFSISDLRNIFFKTCFEKHKMALILRRTCETSKDIIVQKKGQIEVSKGSNYRHCLERYLQGKVLPTYISFLFLSATSAYLPDSVRTVLCNAKDTWITTKTSNNVPLCNDASAICYILLFVVWEDNTLYTIRIYTYV
jgi:hypothetical protein